MGVSMKQIFVIAFLMVSACGPQLQPMEDGSGNAESGTVTLDGGAGVKNPPAASSQNPLEIVIKLRVYQLSFPSSPSYNSTFSSNTIKQYVAEVNEIYQQANIRIELESIKALAAPSAVQFSSSETNQSFVQKIGKIQFPAANTSYPLFQAAFFYGFPISAKGLYVHQQKVAYVGEYFLKTGELQGAVVLAHELGHELSLPHANTSGQACTDSNLLCTGGTGIGEYLSAEQITAMRAQAVIGPASK